LQKKIVLKLTAQPTIQFPPLKTLRTLYDFDDQVTAKLHGFTGADAYYAQSSSRQYLSGIRISTLLLQAKDDPFMSEDLLPVAQELPCCVRLELSEKGGHLGFVTGVPWSAEYWLEKRALVFLEDSFV